MSQDIAVQQLDDMISKLSKTIALEVTEIIDKLRKQSGKDVAALTTVRFLAAMTTVSVIRALEIDPALYKTQQEHYQLAYKALATHKTLVQDAVSGGFSSAMSSFSGHPIEYYCQIKTVPADVSKAVN